jgi:hypothetical protein
MSRNEGKGGIIVSMLCLALVRMIHAALSSKSCVAAKVFGVCFGSGEVVCEWCRDRP